MSDAVDATLTVTDAPRELLAVREIASALLLADRPSDVYQFALDRVTPLLGAAFSVVMQLGEDGDLLRPVAQHEWPQKHRAWIGALRVRVGDGPSGLAVAERRVVEVEDLFADPTLTAWHDVARELGFQSIIAAPLVGARRTLGAVVFYFREPQHVSPEGLALVRLVADQLATAAEKAATMDALRRANGALAEANAELESQAQRAESMRAESARLLDALTGRLTDALAPGALSVEQHADGGAAALAAARAVATAARELVLLRSGTVVLRLDEIEPRLPLQDAVTVWRERVRAVPIVLGEPTVLLPSMHTDRGLMARMLELVVGHAVALAHGPQGLVHADVELGRGFVSHRVRCRVAPADAVDTPPHAVHPAITPFDLDLAAELAVRLGGELRVERFAGEGDEQGDQERAGDGRADAFVATTVFPLESGR